MTSLTYFFIFIVILSSLFLILNFLFAPHNPYQEKTSAFECGYHSFLQNRTPFSVDFFLWGILFLIFDLELVMLFPFATSMADNGIYGLCLVIIFIAIIALGFLYEIAKGALMIPSKQQDNKNKLWDKLKFNPSVQTLASQGLAKQRS